MSKGVVIVFEARPRWAPELERQLYGEDARIQSCRTLDDVSRIVASVVDQDETSQRAVAVIDLSVAAAESLQFLGRFRPETRRCPVIVIGTSQSKNLEWPLRELGVLEWLLDTVSGEQLARLCRRQLQSSSQ